MITVFFVAEYTDGASRETINIMTKPLNVEAPEFTPTREVSKTTQQLASETAEYYSVSLLREAVYIVNEKLKLDQKVHSNAAIREEKSELPKQIFSDPPLRLPSERALIGGELFDQICEDEGPVEGGVGGNGRDLPLGGMVGGATTRTVTQQRKVRQVLFILGVCRIRSTLRQQTVGDDEESLDEDQFYTEENNRLKRRIESMMQEILQMRFELSKMMELINGMKTEISQMGEKRRNDQRMVKMVPSATTTAHRETARENNWPRRTEGNPPIPTPMLGHLLNRRRLRDKHIKQF